MSDDNWGPWIEHKGRGFPRRLLGKILEVEAIASNGFVQRQVGWSLKARNHVYRAWNWRYFGEKSPDGWGYSKIIRYRLFRGDINDAKKLILNECRLYTTAEIDRLDRAEREGR